MQREITNVLSAGIDIYNCVICLFLLFSITHKFLRTKSNFYFAAVTISILLINLGDIVTWLFEGTAHPWNGPLLRVGTFVYYIIVPIAFLFLMRYIEEYIYPVKVNHIYFKIGHIVSIVYLILTIFSLFTGWFYYISDDNYYHRGKLNFISTICYAIFYILSVTIVIVNHKKISRKANFLFLSYSFFPIVTQLIQTKFYGLALVNTAMTFSLLLLFMNLHKELELNNENMEKVIDDKEKKLIKFQEHTIASLSNLVENRDLDTGEHAQRTSYFVKIIATQAFEDKVYPEILTEEYINLMVQAAPMHDIGKIVVSDSVLKKPGALSDDEYSEMKEHAVQGGKIVQEIIGFSDDKNYLQVAINMAQSHHERWDGTGYPENLKGDEIPVCARIMAIADVFDALVFERCYKLPIAPDQAFTIIANESGTHFDPVLIKEFLKAKDKILHLLNNYSI